MHTATQSWSQKGKVEFKPFLDADGNGVKNDLESWIGKNQLVVGSNEFMKAKYGMRKENLYQAYKAQGFDLDLVPFSEYQVSKKYQMVQVRPFPHIINYISIPVTIQGSLSGRVRKPVNGWEGQEPSHWKVLVQHSKTGKTDTLRTLPSGRFYQSSLSRGTYTVQLLPDQLEHYKVAAEPGVYRVVVTPQKGKRRFTNLNFSLKEKLAN
jgi:hypothetical protein